MQKVEKGRYKESMKTSYISLALISWALSIGSEGKASNLYNPRDIVTKELSDYVYQEDKSSDIIIQTVNSKET